jgi:hypothetical protein
MKSYKKILDKVMNCYVEILKNKPEEKLNMKEIMKPAKMKISETYIAEMSMVGNIIDLIKE